MTKYEVKAVVSDYGIFENGELKLIVNSQANALMIKYVLEQDLKHKVVIEDLLKSKDKPKHKFRAMTNGEFCEKWQKKHKYCKPHGKLALFFFLVTVAKKTNLTRPKMRNTYFGRCQNDSARSIRLFY